MESPCVKTNTDIKRHFGKKQQGADFPGEILDGEAVVAVENNTFIKIPLRTPGRNWFLS